MTQFVFTKMIPADLDALVRTVYGELRDKRDPHLLRGQQAIVCVIRNRAVLAAKYEKEWHKAHPLFGNGSIYKVCHTKAQFSCWNNNDLNRKAIEGLPAGGDIYKELKAHIVEWLNQDDITDGATHYVTKAVAHDTAWTYDATETGQIGTHIFFRDVG